MSDHSITHATFTLERTYGASPDRVFAAWADRATKARWFAGGEPGYELDFRPGGSERLVSTHEGTRFTWESLYREIVPGERIVYTSVLAEHDTVATVSLTTVELSPEAGGTRLVLVEAGAYLDGREQPVWREDGTGGWLDALAGEFEPVAP